MLQFPEERGFGSTWGLAIWRLDVVTISSSVFLYFCFGLTIFIQHLLFFIFCFSIWLRFPADGFLLPPHRQALTVVRHLMTKPALTKTLYILTILILLLSCNFGQKKFSDRLDDLRKDYSKEAEINNAKILAWETIVDSIYKLADTNKISSLKTVDNLILNDTTLNSEKINELHFIKGDIYYCVDSFHKAIDEFSASERGQNFVSPKLLAAKAGAYINLKNFDSSLFDLKKAAEINYDYYWNVGNYYEIVGKKDSAISNYQKLYLRDTTIYRDCKKRIEELNKNKPKLLKELIYRDRERKIILMSGET